MRDRESRAGDGATLPFIPAGTLAGTPPKMEKPDRSRSTKKRVDKSGRAM